MKTTITYDKVRHHLTATDRRAITAALERIGTANSIGLSTGRNRYSISRDGAGFRMVVQNNEGQYTIPFSAV